MEANVVRTFIISMSAATLALGVPATAQQQQGAAAAKPLTRTTLSTQLDSAFASVDANKDGSLNATELGAAQKKDLERAQAAVRARAQAAFQQLDTNKNGQLSPDEFAASVQVNANETAAQVLQKMDTNKDGKVSAQEFKTPRLAAFDRVDANKDGTVTPAELRASQRK